MSYSSLRNGGTGRIPAKPSLRGNRRVDPPQYSEIKKPQAVHHDLRLYSNVGPGGFEPPTHGFSVRCSTD